MIGFGPMLWSRVSGETSYGFKAIPVGGYVRIIGMLPPPPQSPPNMVPTRAAPGASPR